MQCSRCGHMTDSLTYVDSEQLCSGCCPPLEITFVCTACLDKAAKIAELEALLCDIKRDMTPEAFKLTRTHGADPCDCTACRLVREVQRINNAGYNGTA